MDWKKCIASRLLHGARQQAGISLVETVMAISLFGLVSTSLITVLTSATVADGLARQRSIALELAQQQVEYVRQLNYSDAGTDGGNPAGSVPPSQKKQVAGLWYELNTEIKWVNDPTPSSFSAYAHYKRVRITVSRVRDGRLLSTVTTFISNAARDALGGIDNAVANIIAEDYATHERLPGVLITLTKDTLETTELTDSTGVATFPALEPTETGEYYEAHAEFSGYDMYKGDIPANFTLEPSGTGGTTVHLYKPSVLNVTLTDGAGGPVYTAGEGTVTLTSVRGSTKTNTTTTGTTSFTTLDDETAEGESLFPDSNYTLTVKAEVPGGCRVGSSAVNPLTVPEDYPDKLETDVEVPLEPDVVPCVEAPTTATLIVNIRRLRSYCDQPGECWDCPLSPYSYTVTIDDDPDQAPPYSESLTAPSGSGVATFDDIPIGTYDIRAVRSWGSPKTLQDVAVPTADERGVCIAMS